VPKILLVDDEPAILELFETVLSVDYETETAVNGAEAIEKIRSHPFDVIVSDVSMPGMDGVELLRLIREQDLDVPVILVTGSPSVDSAIQAVEYGALLYLTKPIRPADLRKVVLHAFRLREMARAKREAYRIVSGDGTGEGPADRAGLEARFDRGMEQMWLAFQPIIRWSSRTMFGYECLLRTDEETLKNPLAFLEAAERLDRLYDLSRRIRDRAGEAVPILPDGQLVFVNLHHRDLQDDHLFDPKTPLAQHASRVVLEITERKSLDSIPDARERMTLLRRMGYRIAMDDLGAGHNGLHAFAKLEPDIVKLDMLLVRGAAEEATRLRVIESMAKLCANLNIEMITEGIETETERDVLTSVGCDLLQGYLFGRPDRNLQSPF
jgi:EAL domain-containing protein (putative c-di-GMP-specific phosphodiesterase class I)